MNAANNGNCGTTVLPRSVGVSYGGNADAGAGYEGISGTVQRATACFTTAIQAFRREGLSAAVRLRTSSMGMLERQTNKDNPLISVATLGRDRAYGSQMPAELRSWAALSQRGALTWVPF
ncbi:MAG: hypothetical protein ACRD2U_07095 [Terriglobales bacterium]